MDNPLLASLFEEHQRRPLTVSELNEKVRRELERSFSSVWIEGEIVGFFEARSGHWYFSLHDGESQVKVTCFKGTNWRIRFRPSDGLQVRVRGSVSVYKPRGEYQVVAESLEPAGEGALRVAYEQVHAKLEAEGLFREEHKRALPFFPGRVGVVTSRNGAAIHDILNVMLRRTRSVSIVLIPTLVQGDTAPEEIKRAILLAERYNRETGGEGAIDVLIVGRGGGSPEDLWAFNEEGLARTIFNCPIPVISAVGHETDFTIADLVADLRAPTPSAAAEIVAAREDDIEDGLERAVRDLTVQAEGSIAALRGSLRELELFRPFRDLPIRISRLRDSIFVKERELKVLAVRRLRNGDARFRGLRSRMSPVRLSAGVGDKKARLAAVRERISNAGRVRMKASRERLGLQTASLDALSPLSVLGRGYSITRDDSGRILRDTASVSKGDRLNVKLEKGELDAEVLGTEE